MLAYQCGSHDGVTRIGGEVRWYGNTPVTVPSTIDIVDAINRTAGDENLVFQLVCEAFDLGLRSGYNQAREAVSA